ncbi:MAG: hypothetical protein MJZ30_09585 [Paludibacteraceae bacterium]|nr:hypothetical protein [Paludibacteraceae bacterium]
MKYELTDNKIVYFGHELYMIKALKDFGDVKAGDFGGYVEHERNLSQCGNAWIYDDAKVYGNAFVCENANVSEDANVYGKSTISCEAYVYGKATVCGSSRVYGRALVGGNAIIAGNAKVFEHALVCEEAVIDDNASVFGCALICKRARVCENSTVCGVSEIEEYAVICGDSKVNGCEDGLCINGNTNICGDAIIKSEQDYITFKNNFSSYRHFTWTKSNDKWSVGCFYGSASELLEKARKESEGKYLHYKAYVDLVEKLKELDRK